MIRFNKKFSKVPLSKNQSYVYILSVNNQKIKLTKFCLNNTKRIKYLGINLTKMQNLFVKL